MQDASSLFGRPPPQGGGFPPPTTTPFPPPRQPPPNAGGGGAYVGGTPSSVHGRSRYAATPGIPGTSSTPATTTSSASPFIGGGPPPSATSAPPTAFGNPMPASAASPALAYGHGPPPPAAQHGPPVPPAGFSTFGTGSMSEQPSRMQKSSAVPAPAGAPPVAAAADLFGAGPPPPPSAAAAPPAASAAAPPAAGGPPPPTSPASNLFGPPPAQQPTVGASGGGDDLFGPPPPQPAAQQPATGSGVGAGDLFGAPPPQPATLGSGDGVSGGGMFGPPPSQHQPPQQQQQPSVLQQPQPTVSGFSSGEAAGANGVFGARPPPGTTLAHGGGGVGASSHFGGPPPTTAMATTGATAATALPGAATAGASGAFGGSTPSAANASHPPSDAASLFGGGPPPVGPPAARGGDGGGAASLFGSGPPPSTSGGPSSEAGGGGGGAASLFGGGNPPTLSSAPPPTPAADGAAASSLFGSGVPGPSTAATEAPAAPPVAASGGADAASLFGAPNVVPLPVKATVGPPLQEDTSARGTETDASALFGSSPPPPSNAIPPNREQSVHSETFDPLQHRPPPTDEDNDDEDVGESVALNTAINLFGNAATALFGTARATAGSVKAVADEVGKVAGKGVLSPGAFDVAQERTTAERDQDRAASGRVGADAKETAAAVAAAPPDDVGAVPPVADSAPVADAAATTALPPTTPFGGAPETKESTDAASLFDARPPSTMTATASSAPPPVAPTATTDAASMFDSTPVPMQAAGASPSAATVAGGAPSAATVAAALALPSTPAAAAFSSTATPSTAPPPQQQHPPSQPPHEAPRSVEAKPPRTRPKRTPRVHPAPRPLNLPKPPPPSSSSSGGTGGGGGKKSSFSRTLMSRQAAASADGKERKGKFKMPPPVRLPPPRRRAERRAVVEKEERDVAVGGGDLDETRAVVGAPSAPSPTEPSSTAVDAAAVLPPSDPLEAPTPTPTKFTKFQEELRAEVARRSPPAAAKMGPSTTEEELLAAANAAALASLSKEAAVPSGTSAPSVAPATTAVPPPTLDPASQQPPSVPPPVTVPMEETAQLPTPRRSFELHAPSSLSAEELNGLVAETAEGPARTAPGAGAVEEEDVPVGMVGETTATGQSPAGEDVPSVFVPPTMELEGEKGGMEAGWEAEEVAPPHWAAVGSPSAEALPKTRDMPMTATAELEHNDPTSSSEPEQPKGMESAARGDESTERATTMAPDSSAAAAAGTAPVPPPPPPPPVDVPPPLPAGWTEIRDPSSGRSYYYNEKDGETTWTRPASEETAVPPPPPPPAVAMDASGDVETKEAESMPSGVKQAEMMPSGVQEEAAGNAVPAKVTEEDEEGESPREEPRAGEEDARANNEPPPPVTTAATLPNEGLNDDGGASNRYPFHYATPPHTTRSNTDPLYAASTAATAGTDYSDVADSDVFARDHSVAGLSEDMFNWDEEGEDKAEGDEGGALPPVAVGTETDGEEYVASAEEEGGDAQPTAEGGDTTTPFLPGVGPSLGPEVEVPSADVSEMMQQQQRGQELSRRRATDTASPVEETAGGGETVGTMSPTTREEWVVVDQETERRRMGLEDNREDGGGEGTVGEAPLPVGWIEQIDPSSGRRYYWNETEGETTWERPQQPPVGGEEEVPTAMGAEDSPASGVDEGGDGGATPAAEVGAALPMEGDPVTPQFVPSTVPEEEEGVDVSSSPCGAPPGFYGEGETPPADAEGVAEDHESGEEEEEEAVVEAPAEQPQEGGSDEWDEFFDPTSGRPYYVNRNDGTTAWEIPSPPPVPAVPMPATEDGGAGAGASVMDAESSTGPEETGSPLADDAAPEEEVHRAAITTTAAAAASAPASTLTGGAEEEEEGGPPPPEAPAAASASTMAPEETVVPRHQPAAPDSGGWDHVTAEETMGSPERAMEGTAAPVPEGVMEDAAGEGGDDLVADGDDTGGEAPAAEVEEEDKPSLPPGWVEYLDPTSGNPYYLNEAEGLTTWERPAPLPGVDAPPPDEGDAVAAEPDRNVQEEAGVEAGPEDAEEVPAAVAGRMDDVDAAAVPAEGESSVPLEAEEAEHEEPPDGKLRDLAAEAPDEKEGEKDNVDDAAAAATALPPGWVELIDPASGNPYYLNEAEGITTWERPPPTTLDEEDISVEMPEESNVEGGEGGEEALGTTTTDEATRELKIDEADAIPEEDASGVVGDETDVATEPKDDDVAAAVEDLPPSTTEAETEETPSPLPPGWTELIDETSGNPYYVNEVEGTTTWDRPTLLSAPSLEDDEGDKEAEIEGGEEVDSGGGGGGGAESDGRMPEEEPASGGAAVASAEPGAVPEESAKDKTRAMMPLEEEEEEGDGAHAGEASAAATEDRPMEDTVPPPPPPRSDALPPGWEELLDEASGNYYYVNEAEGITTWDRPASVAPPPPISEVSEEASGSKVPEVGGEHAENVDDFEGGGEVVEVSETKGKDRESPQVGDSGPASAGGAVEVTERGFADTTEVVEEEAATATSGEEADETAKANDDEPSSELLPAGWVELIDPTSGNPYYSNEAEGITTWDRPSAPPPKEKEGVPEVGEETVEERSPPATDAALEGVQETTTGTTDEDDNADSPVDPSHQTKEEEEKTTEEIAAAAADDHTNDELPPGWVELVDPTSGNLYYSNEAEGITTWDRPSASPPPPPTKAPTKKTEEDGALVSSRGLELEGGGGEETEPGAVSSPPEDGAVEGAPPLVPEVPAAEASTQDETADFPNGDDGVMVEAPPPTDIANQKEEVGGTTTGEEAPPPEDSAAEDEDGTAGLPPGWVEVIDPQSGNPYYSNEATGITTWDRPAAPADVAKERGGVEDSEKAEEEEKEQAPPTEETKKPEKTTSTGAAPMATARELEPELIEEQEETISLNDDKEGAKVDEDDDDDALPPGWVELIDPSSGNVYYSNEETDVTTWDRPAPVPKKKEKEDEVADKGDDVPAKMDGGEEEPSGQDDAKRETSASAASVTTGTTTTKTDTETEKIKPKQDETSEEEPKKKDDDDDLRLPEGWVEIFDPGTGTPYYYNGRTNETTWDKPSVPSTPTPAVVDTDPSLGVGGVGVANKGIREQRMRPAHAIATFGFGGRLCIMIPQVATRLSAPGGGNTTTAATDETKKSFRKGPVAIRRLCNVVPPSANPLGTPSGDGDDGKNKPNVVMGPLNSIPADVVFAHLKTKAQGTSTSTTTSSSSSDKDDESDNNMDDLLWSVIEIAARCKGRLRCDKGVDDVNGPEAAVVKLLLGSGKDKDKDGVGEEEEELMKKFTPVKEDKKNELLELSSSLDSVQSLLLHGKRHDAVQHALYNKNYALALLIASVCIGDDNYIWRNTARTFANETLSTGSPLHAICTSFTSFGTDPVTTQWGSGHKLRTSWKYHLCTILNNRTVNWDRTILSLGDALYQIGEVEKAHLCYMVCGHPITPPKRTSRLTLVGCDHTIPNHSALLTPQGIKSYVRTEAFEWAKRRGNPRAAIPCFQPYKLRYATNVLCEWGYEVQSLEYVNSLRQCTGLVAKSNGGASGGDVESSKEYPKEFVDMLDVFEDRVCVSLGVDPSWTREEKEKKGGSGVKGVLENFTSVFSMGGGGRGGASKSAEKPQGPAGVVKDEPSVEGPTTTREIAPDISADVGVVPTDVPDGEIKQPTTEEPQPHQQQQPPAAAPPAPKPELPNGWVELKDEASGDLYYYNEIENVTTWDRPTFPVKKEEVQQPPPVGAVADASKTGAEIPMDDGGAEGNVSFVSAQSNLLDVTSNSVVSQESNKPPPAMVDEIPKTAEKGPEPGPVALGAEPPMVGEATTAAQQPPIKEEEEKTLLSPFGHKPPVNLSTSDSKFPPPVNLDAKLDDDDDKSKPTTTTNKKKGAITPAPRSFPGFMTPGGVQSAPPSINTGPPPSKPGGSSKTVDSKVAGKKGKVKQQAPSSERKGGKWSIRDWVTKRLNPDATCADVGEKMEAYYDEKLKRWIFPGDDPNEVAKPLPPPPTAMPTTPTAGEEKEDGGGEEEKQGGGPPMASTPAAAADPLAALMAPPSRPPSAMRSGGGGALGKGGRPPRSRYADPMMAGMTMGGPPGGAAAASAATPGDGNKSGGGPPMGTTTPAAAGGGAPPMMMEPPKFTVFQPKPGAAATTAPAAAPPEEKE